MFKSILQHLRIPYSFYLMPIFAFAACQYPFADARTLIISFVAIHLFLYPADNGYNSWFEKRTAGYITLRNYSPVPNGLLFVSIVFDAVGILLGLLISWQFSVMLLIYGLVSKAFSHPFIRLKKYGFTALAIVAIFQGGFTYLMSFLALHHLNFHELNDPKIYIPASLCSIMILGFYPMTQIYQHSADKEHGDKTASMILGINGTFIFSAIVFLIGNFGFYFYFTNYFHRVVYFILFQIFLSPLFAFFILWYFAFLVDENEATHRNAMIMTKISAACLMAFFITTAILQNRF